MDAFQIGCNLIPPREKNASKKTFSCDWDGGRDATIVPNTDDMQRVDMETVSEHSLHSPALFIKYAFLATMEETVIFPKCFQSSGGTSHRRPGWRRMSILAPARVELLPPPPTHPPSKDRFYMNLQKMD